MFMVRPSLYMRLPCAFQLDLGTRSDAAHVQWAPLADADDGSNPPLKAGEILVTPRSEATLSSLIIKHRVAHTRMRASLACKL